MCIPPPITLPSSNAPRASPESEINTHRNLKFWEVPSLVMARLFYGNISGRRPLEFKIYNGYSAHAILSVGNELLLTSLAHSK
ncbi:hypothetical protein CEXT_351601 [Caerostris extrusa]|uniref:Uncharacterized protein n=1 Tax=Caerostris extrusa TaxID=172846 RepID=A0AAV4T641_CAEEX|nr:hypothetical protein CEXT_351601 [Caerostris extrusa]